MSSQDQTTQDQTTTIEASRATRDLLDTVASDGGFTTLVAGLHAAGLAAMLQGPGLLTLFAPTDKAFARLSAEELGTLFEAENREKLTALLSRHIVRGALKSEDLRMASSLRPLSGPPITVRSEAGKVTVDGIPLVRRDHPCTNGVLHVIDELLTKE
jgi:uncharacterized surface protein with fasciclin (FAS1) repeats